MRVGSLFAGIGGFDLGFENAGMETAWQVELNDKCRAVLERHFPAAERFADIRECGATNLSPVDVICGGFPCQDLSVAGKRAGLAGERSGLFYEMTRITDELRPAWLVWENVPGLLSSHRGADFARVLVELERIGYHGAWTTVDARYFGVAQRRRRVFGVFTRLDSGAERAAEVLALSARMRGYPPPRSEAREAVAGTLGGGAAGRGRRDNPDSSGAFVPAYALRSDPGGTGQGHNTNYVASPIAASAGHHGHGSPRGDGADNLVTREWPQEVAPTLNTAYGTKWGLEDQNALGGGGLFVPTTVGALHTASGRASTTTEDGGQIIAATVTSKWAKGSGGPAGSEEGNLVAPVLMRQREGRPGGGKGPLLSEGVSLSRAANTNDQTLFANGVRRLTPTECERLQGFPDGWTEWHADSHRYRMLGNAVERHCAEWIGRRLVKQ